MAKGIENRARSPPAVFDFATSQIQKHGGTKMYYDLIESGKRIKALRKEHGLTQEQLAEQLGVAANTIARIETGNRGISIFIVLEPNLLMVSNRCLDIVNDVVNLFIMRFDTAG